MMRSLKPKCPLILAALLLAFIVIPASSETETERIRRLEARSFLAPLDSPEHRQYAPDREIDILNLALDVTPDFKRRTLAGQAILKFKPIAKPFDVLRLDAVDLTIESVSATEKVLAHQVTDKKLIVTFAQPIPPNRPVTVTVQYHAEPSKGLYFRTPEMGYRPGETHLFTQGEAIEARCWYPGFDSPNEKFTSEITCRVPEGMTVLSNGRLVSEIRDPITGLVAVHWRQDKPHVNYLISLVAGYFKRITGQYKDIPLAFYTPPSQINEATHSFRDTSDMMAFFEKEIGVPYPWVKYDQVCVNDFVAGGMENTSITTLTDQTLFTAATENLRSSQGLVAHELSHQWFGDLVTCKDWSQLWLNEGFATYYGHLYLGHKNGRNTLLYLMYHDARSILNQPDDTRPIVNRQYDSPGEEFGYRAYQKGGWVLHMLRGQLGDPLYRRCIKTYLRRHQFDTVVTEDLRAVIEELSGRSYDQFFDQWLYHAHHPELDVSYSWDDQTKLAKLSIQQVQKLSETILLFRFPLTVRFKSKARAVDRQVMIKAKAEDFYFPLDRAPETVRVDPDLHLLARINFNRPDPLLYAQLADPDDLIGRLIAVEQLARKKDQEAVTKLKATLNQDGFYGVRLEASQALRSIHTDEALEALLASLQQPDARVRRQVVADLGGFYRETAYAALRQVIEKEKNPDIISQAIQALGAYGKPEVRDSLLAFLNSDSYRHGLAEAAIGAMRAQEDPVLIKPLQENLSRQEAKFTTAGFARALKALAFLARHDDPKDAVREFLIKQVNHPKKGVQLAALAALGTLADTKAAAVLETFTTAAKDSPERTAAESALAALQAAQKPADELKGLRTEVLDLQKTSRDLRKEIEELKKKVDAQSAPKPATPAPKKPVLIPPKKL